MEQEYNIVIAGVGGLGILTATRILAEAALIEGKNVMSSEIHGLAQRYGSIISTLRIGKVLSPLIKKSSADLLIGLEPIETLRNIHYLKNDGYLILNLNIIPPPSVAAGLEDYPSIDEILNALNSVTKYILKVNALEIAMQLGQPVLQNTILLGMAFSIPGFPLKPESGELAIRKVFKGREKIIDPNIKAFKKGREIGESLIKSLY